MKNYFTFLPTSSSDSPSGFSHSRLSVSERVLHPEGNKKEKKKNKWCTSNFQEASLQSKMNLLSLGFSKKFFPTNRLFAIKLEIRSAGPITMT
jgi:hypothetical protein